jgi:predicted nucleotidyltransferase
MYNNIQSISSIKDTLTPVFSSYNVKKAVLFGSYAKGYANIKSDVDIVVDSGLRGLDFVGLLGAVQEALRKNVDMIDVQHIEKASPIEHEIEKTGVIIYAQ